MPENKAIPSQQIVNLWEEEFIKQVKGLSFPFLYGNITITVQAGAPTLVTFENKIKV